jgi:hypothetical protein
MTRVAFSLISSCVFLLAATRAHGQETDVSAAWPPVTQTARPWTRWWWPGSAVNERDLTKQLAAFAEAGLGGVEITPIYGARGAETRDIPFLSAQWMRMLEHSSREATRFGLGLDMATGTGWPFGGPGVTASQASQKITFENGRLAGQPTLMQVKRAAPGGEGLVLDPYSTTAIQTYLQPFSRAFSEFAAARPRAQFHDSFEYYDAGWTPKFEETFLRMHGYDIQAHAAQLMGVQPLEADTLARMKSDYRETLAQMHLDYLSMWVNWSYAHGFLARNQSHGAPANLLDLYGAVDIPETESFGSSAFPIAGLRRGAGDFRADHSPPHPLVHRMASSAAHVMGHPLTSSETLTWLREHWRESPSAAKPQIDQLFAAGINHIFYHGTVYTPSEVEWPGWYFYASTQLSVTNPLWQDFAALNAYVTRVQSVLQSGKPDNDVLLYWPFADELDSPKGWMRQFAVENATWLLDSAAGRMASRLVAKGYAFDFISDDQLLQTRFERGVLSTPGNRYRAIVVPATRRMPVATLARLRALIHEGATVIFESLPEDVPGYGRLEQRREEFRAALRDPALASAVVGGSIEAALEAHDIAREPMADSGLSFVRRSQHGGRDYFIVNQTAERFEGWISLSTRARSAVLLEPLTGRAGIATSKSADNKAVIYLQLASGESLLLRTRNDDGFGAIAPWRYVQPAGTPFALEGEWSVNFVAGGPVLPAPVQMRALKSWTELEDAQAHRFAGTARYRIEFDAPEQQADEWLLDLGDVREVARVRLNGKQIATAWSLPFQVRLGSLKQRGNVLEMDVTNLAANRIRDMDRRKVSWRVMKDVDIVDIQYRPFDAASWEPTRSGLLGPVSLVPLRNVDAAERNIEEPQKSTSGA